MEVKGTRARESNTYMYTLFGSKCHLPLTRRVTGEEKGDEARIEGKGGGRVWFYIHLELPYI